ncbi:MAG: ChbG/HpnK family deacetylase [Pseudomonadota bacterium]
MSLIPIALCADDFGQHAGVDHAVCELVDLGRLSALSCMSGAPRWQQESAPMLKERGNRADIGLHFNLTENFGITPGTPLSKLILRAYARQLDHNALKNSLNRQLDDFETALQRSPDFIDGHQHVHQLPAVRDVLLDTLATRYRGQAVWVRNVLAADPRWGGKTRVLEILGGKALHAKLLAAKIATNQGFAGVYGFDTDDYAGRFAQWLQPARPGMLVMCHPGTSEDGNDPITRQRLVEYRFFKSEQFAVLLEGAGLRLERLSAILARPSGSI